MLRCRNHHGALAVIGLTAVLFASLGAGIARAQTAPSEELGGDDTLAPETYAIAKPYADRFPNVVLKTHEGKNVRFYDDLLKDKVVLINFFYVTCSER